MENKIEWHWTCEDAWLDRWDRFQFASPRGHYLQLSHWLKSYRAYGFDFQVLVGYERASREICIGIGSVIVRAPFIKGYVAPVGPIVAPGFESLVNEAIGRFKDHAQRSGALFCQIYCPASPEPVLPQMFRADFVAPVPGARSGFAFDDVSSINGFRWVDLRIPKTDFESVLLGRFSGKTARNIKLSLKCGLELTHASTRPEIREAYECFAESARSHQYSIRSWEDLGPTLVALVEQGYSYILCARKGGEIKGAIWLVNAGCRLTYMMGGTRREKPDLNVGFFLQWHGMRLASEMGYDGYDISVGGSSGVVKFKEGFASRHIEFGAPSYWVFNRPKFWAFKSAYPWLRRHKSVVVRLLQVIKAHRA